ncbi:hypothetical protein Psal006b_01522 [Piscirickettsia salmonis]|uniref:Uncharacterized protein n=1 Tax=Piscirickettsia salmonis TaxID=1238 RepID=A0A1L6TC09_PISSA|nr:hypothetical protein [Piscirickettsia salmonis]AKP74020.1 hypothetical protein PSLF89_2299 [Piscirickettsia salmonis LF-89 = ATCC VR-1361]ALB22868.1 hypothetical protein KU39_1686 [Piscirickettsia salmonis]ALY02841.1 hypothetical protein AWE47_08240 [Piscirickettsia salmonis]AMA42396.1 hypothetical protein AWJ11_08455 [Piscirickettsia salmonis]AOS34866.1 hypothetical protein AVM72_05595 [Piscirickettsia salmonis]
MIYVVSNKFKYNETELNTAMRISPTSALLLVLKKCPEKKEIISPLLFEGRCALDEDDLNTILNSLALLYPRAHYEVVTDPDFIYNDPIRRYLESQFAVNFLLKNLEGVDSTKLDDLINNYLHYFSTEQQAKIQQVLDGTALPEDSLLHKEYADAILNAQSNTNYTDFSPDEQQKITKLLKLSFLSLQVTNYGYCPSLSINTHNQTKPEKLDQEKAISQHMGLIKSYHPLTADDSLLREQPTTFTKPADKFSYTPSLSPTQQGLSYSSLVNPSSSNASEAMLAQISVLTDLRKNKHQLQFDQDELIKYLHTFASVILLNSGTHSYYEALSPLNKYRIKDALGLSEVYDIENNIEINNIVTNKTLNYFHKIELKHKLHVDLASRDFNKITATLKECDLSLKEHDELLQKPSDIERILDNPLLFTQNCKKLAETGLLQPSNIQRMLKTPTLFAQNYKLLENAKLLHPNNIEKILNEPLLYAHHFNKLEDAALLQPEYIQQVLKDPDLFIQNHKKLEAIELLEYKYIKSMLENPILFVKNCKKLENAGLTRPEHIAKMLESSPLFAQSYKYLEDAHLLRPTDIQKMLNDLHSFAQSCKILQDLRIDSGD